MKGYQKKVIFLKNTGSNLFDEAYFVMSRDGENSSLGEEDMVSEANRIIDESLGIKRGEKKGISFGRFASRTFPFLLGSFITAAVFVAVLLIG